MKDIDNSNFHNVVKAKKEVNPGKAKIAFIITKSEVGGAQSWVRDQVLYAQGNGQVFLITSEKGWLTEVMSNIPCMVDRGLLSRFSLLYLIKLVKYIKSNGITTLVASSANAGIYARLAKIFTGIKCIYVSHGWSSVYNGGRLEWFYTGAEKYLSLITDAVLCVSKSDYTTALKKIGIKERKLKLIRNGVNPEYKIKEKMVFSYHKENVFKVLFLGRLAAPKRPDLLVEAVSTLNNVELHIVGDGLLRPLIEKKAYANVILHGEKKNFNEFDKYDIFSLISDSEGLPVSALEAGSSGLPMILSNVGGCPELITENGIMVENKIEELRLAIINLIDNYDAYSKSAKNVADYYKAKPLEYRELYNL